MSETHKSRLGTFKANTKGTQDLRRKRAEQSVALRRAARDEQLQKRRAVDHGDDCPLSPESGDAMSPPPASPEKLLPLPDIIDALNSDVRATQLVGANAARKILSREQNPPIDKLVKAGCVPRLIELLQYDDCTDLQFEASWALTNIASGTSEQTSVVVEANAIPSLVRLMSSPNVSVSEQCLWALGNIAGEGAWARDRVHDAGVLRPLLHGLQHTLPGSSWQRTAVWALSNLCRNKNPQVDFDKILPALPILSELLLSQDKDVLADACWALSYLTDGPNERIEAVQHANILIGLVPLLGHPAASVQTPALRALGNMVTGTDDQTDRVLAAGALPMLRRLLQSPRSGLVKEATWAVCNILAGTSAQIQALVDADLLPSLVKVLSHSETKCQREAAWSITNMTLEATTQQLGALLSAGALRPYLSLLGGPDPKTTLVVLDGLSNLLKRAEALGELENLCMSIEEDGFLDKLEALQHHQNEEIYNKTLKILDAFFSDEENKDNNLAPQENNGEFQFGTNSGHIGGF